jgi:ABC-type dipeptide/oligopeptide/nickel transport system permease component
MNAERPLVVGADGRRLQRNALSLIASVLLVGIVTALLFLLAVRWYSPGSGSFGAIAGGLNAWPTRSSPTDFGDVSATRGLTQQGATPILLISAAALNSALLLVLAVLVACALGVPAGFWIAIHAPRRVVSLLRSMTNLGIALPAFFLAFLLQVGAVELAGRTGRTVLPVYGFGLDSHLIIPVLSLAAAPFAYIARLVLVAATELNVRDFVRTARAKGLSEHVVVYRHIAPNMFGAIGEAVLGGTRLVLGGLVIVEYLVLWPGLGILALRAANVQDFGILLACVGVIGILFFATEVGLDVVTRRTGVVTG